MNNIDEKLEKIFTIDLIKTIQDIGILQAPDGSYALFGSYYIHRNGEKDYLLTVSDKYTEHKFYSLKNAVAWCIYDKRNKIVESKRILQLDQKLMAIDSSINLHRQLMKSVKDQEQKLIYFSKLTDEKMKRLQIARELGNYLSESKLWQERRFAENNKQK